MIQSSSRNVRVCVVCMLCVVVAEGFSVSCSQDKFLEDPAIFFAFYLNYRIKTNIFFNLFFSFNYHTSLSCITKPHWTFIAAEAELSEGPVTGDS